MRDARFVAAGGAFVVALLLALRSADGLPQQGPRMSGELRVSSFNAAPGELISVGVEIDPEHRGTLAGVSGEIEYDNTALSYVGQVVDSAVILVTRTADTTRGSIGFAALRNIRRRQAPLEARAAVFAFRVLRQPYVATLALTLNEGVTTAPLRERPAGERSLRATAAGDLPSPASARRVRPDEWVEIVGEFPRSGDVEPEGRTGGPSPNREGAAPTANSTRFAVIKYGDANANGSLSISDVVLVMNWSVGTNTLPDWTAQTLAAGNVEPVNPTPPLPSPTNVPGWPGSVALHESRSLMQVRF